MKKIITKVRKRDGRIVDFEQEKITNVISKALTATKQGDGKKAEKLSGRVVDLALHRFKTEEIPTVEQIQDIVEEVLILEGYAETAKAYILYREQHRRIREALTAIDEEVEMVDQYIEELDWQVKENANMAYSLQGLNHYVTSAVTKNYWLNKIYSPNVREGVENGDFHIHNLDTLATYCCGWDLYDLLIKGFGGVGGKVESKPAKHFLTVLSQTVNFFYTLQGESAGAQAFSSFDTLLAPFIRYDNLSYHQVKQGIQMFLFNLAIPTRVGFQCLSEDTKILSSEGWKSYYELKEGDVIYTFNAKNGQLEKKPTNNIFIREYQGTMYNLRNRSQDQLISPRHRVVRQVFNADKYKLEPIEEVLKLKSPVSIPVSGENINPDLNIDDEQLKFLAWTLSEGTIEKDGSHRVSIYQSPAAQPENYTERPQIGLGTCTHIRLLPAPSKIIHQWLGATSKKFPSFLFSLSKRQARLFLETYIKGDGWEEKYRKRIVTTNKEILEGLEAIAVLAGYNFAVNERKPHILTLTETKHDYIQKIREVDYQGIIWSVHTENETVIAQRNGQIFVTGNTPFTNITLDITPSPNLANQPVIIGGEPQKENYSEFQEEMNMINRALFEVMMEGDAKQRVFTFPIPTINITNDFPWDEPALAPMWEATAKYGVNYFSNFIQSDMKPEDVRSMCLAANEEILIRNSKKIKRLTIKEIAENYKINDFDKEGWADCKKEGDLEVLSLNPKTFQTEWSGVKRFLRVFDKEGIRITLEDGKEAIYSTKHPMAIWTEKGIQMKFAKDLKPEEYLLCLKKTENSLSQEYQKIEDFTFDEDVAKILGYFTADGNYLFETRRNCSSYGRPRGIQFTFNSRQLENLYLIKDLVKKVFGCETFEKKDPRYNTYYLYIYNSDLARRLFDTGFRKYDKLPQILFNSPKEVIKAFLEFYFKGDGYQKRLEIHLNDLALSRDLVLLYSLIGQPTTYKLRKNSQRIYLQHKRSKTKKRNGWVNNPIIAERVPGWMTSTYQVPGLTKSRMVGFDTLDKYDAQTKEINKIRNSDIYITRIKTVKKKKFKVLKEFYDLELEKNHLFVHSLGQITFNCCRLRLDNSELLKRGGGLFGSNPLTGCYDKQTEILTENGWKFFKDLSKNDEVFTLTENNEIEIHKPKRLFEYNYEGEMYQFKTRSLNLLVTPNHRMVVDQVGSGKRKFVEAENFDFNNQRIPKQSIWQGEEKEWFILPAIEITKYGRQGRTSYQVIRNALRIKMDNWLKFFGFWLAEGCTDNKKIAPRHGYRVVITQIEKKKRKEIKEILDSLPFNYAEEKNNFVICNKQLWSYLRQFGKKYDKFIPQEIKNLSKRRLKILFDWMVKGDGHIRKTTGQINYWTSSKKLADDLQEIILKLGWLATLTTQNKKTTLIKGRKIKAGICYSLGVQKAQHYRLRKNNIKRVNYKGKVYCCEVKNHTVFVRRNGKVTWCGNSIGVVTINMPRLGYLSKTKKEFFERLGTTMDLIKESLEIKRKALENFIEKGLYPYSKFYLDGVKKMRGVYFGNHFSTIGLVGMNEALLNFIGENIASKTARKFTLEILDFMREKLVEYQQETGNLYNLEATPAESTAYRLALKDKKKYPEIITAGTKENPYYTNSTMLPVNYTDDIFEVLKLQDEIQCKYTGGVVMHLFLGERISDIEVVKNLIRKIFGSFKLPYITLTPTFSICPSHGYLDGEHFECPKCTIKQPCEVYTRIVGYLRPVSQWNQGKQQEFKERKEFTLAR